MKIIMSETKKEEEINWLRVKVLQQTATHYEFHRNILSNKVYKVLYNMHVYILMSVRVHYILSSCRSDIKSRFFMIQIIKQPYLFILKTTLQIENA